MGQVRCRLASMALAADAIWRHNCSSISGGDSLRNLNGAERDATGLQSLEGPVIS